MMNTKDILNYVDSMMIIDKNYHIIYTNRFNAEVSRGFMENDYIAYIDKQYFEVYPALDQKESSMMEALQTGKTIYREGQTFMDMRGRVYTTNNVTYPIILHGKIVGALELSQDLTSVGDLQNKKRGTFKGERNVEYKAIYDAVSFSDIITQNMDMLENIKRAQQFALDDNPILVYGETGTGKEMFVEAMVNSNVRRRKKYIAQNCAAIPENLFESILYGSVKGAFTGAENRIGLFEMADEGILFLDELNSMPLNLQAKLLRVLQDGKIRPVGGMSEKKVDVKVVVAINKNPTVLIRENLLREDLFYRLSGSMLYLNALRDRQEDIPLYVDYFLGQANYKYQKSVAKLSPGLKKTMLKYDWPGNVRELRHVMESMVNSAEGSGLTTKNLPLYLKEVLDEKEASMESAIEPAMGESPAFHLATPLQEVLDKVEKEYILKALVYCGGNVSRAADLLSMPRQTLKFRMDKLSIVNYK